MHLFGTWARSTGLYATINGPTVTDTNKPSPEGIGPARRQKKAHRASVRIGRVQSSNQTDASLPPSAGRGHGRSSGHEALLLTLPSPASPDLLIPPATAPLLPRPPVVCAPRSGTPAPIIIIPEEPRPDLSTWC
jgi:hypothetical protein